MAAKCILERHCWDIWCLNEIFRLDGNVVQTRFLNLEFAAYVKGSLF